MDNKIKSADLCGRCVYNYYTYCTGRRCLDCERYDGITCKCETSLRNTPCPDFKEAPT